MKLTKHSCLYYYCSGIQNIEGLQTHQNFEVYKSALAIIDKYFSEEVSSWQTTAKVQVHLNQSVDSYEKNQWQEIMPI